MARGVQRRLLAAVSGEEVPGAAAELSTAAGELTAKGTIRRAAILAAFGDLVDEMYDAGDLDEIARQARFAKPRGRSGNQRKIP